MGDEFGDDGRGAFVDFHGGDACGVRGDQGAGEPAGAGADLNHMAPGQVAGLAGDAIDEVHVQQEMLAELFTGIELMRGDDLAQRGEPHGEPHGERRGGAWVRFRHVDRSPRGVAGRASSGGR